MVHEAQLDTAADSAVCPNRRLLIIAKSFHAVALKNAASSANLLFVRWQGGGTSVEQPQSP
jgi:hypothetical protein